jgi:hypothetical protein
MAVPSELRSESLIGLYERFGSVASPLAKYFPAVGAANTSRYVAYDILTFDRALGHLVPYGSKAPVANAPAQSRVVYEPPTIKDKIPLDIEFMKSVRDVGSLNPNQAAYVARMIRQVRMGLDYRLEWLRAQWLTAGALLTSAGVAPSTATFGTVYLDYAAALNSAPMAVSLGFTASHLDSVVGASWATAGTDIKGDLDAARTQISLDSGLDASRVILNSTTMKYIYGNTAAQKSDWFNDQLTRYGRITELWGYTFDIVDNYLPFSAETMATDTGAVGLFKSIPNNVVVLTVPESQNDAAGRSFVEIAPDDAQAPEGARGFYPFVDGDWQHPHVPEVGYTFTGGPTLMTPDSTYVFDDVTSTS